MTLRTVANAAFAKRLVEKRVIRSYKTLADSLTLRYQFRIVPTTHPGLFHVTHLAQTHILGLEYLLKGGESEVFNLRNGSGFSVREVIETTKKVTRREIKIEKRDRRLGDPPILVAAATKQLKFWHWHPQYPNVNEIPHPCLAMASTTT